MPLASDARRSLGSSKRNNSLSKSNGSGSARPPSRRVSDPKKYGPTSYKENINMEKEVSGDMSKISSIAPSSAQEFRNRNPDGEENE